MAGLLDPPLTINQNINRSLVSHFRMKHFKKGVSKLEAVIQKFPKATQEAITCSKLTIETLEQSVKYVQS